MGSGGVESGRDGGPSWDLAAHQKLEQDPVVGQQEGCPCHSPSLPPPAQILQNSTLCKQVTILECIIEHFRGLVHVSSWPFKTRYFQDI